MRKTWVVVYLLAGCGGFVSSGPPPYRVVVAAAAPLDGARCRVSPSSMVFSPQLIINGVVRGAYMATLSQQQQQSLEEDLRQMNAHYVEWVTKQTPLARHGETAPLRFVPRVSSITLGTYSPSAFGGSSPTEVEVVVDVVDAQSQALVERMEMPQMVVSQAGSRFSSGQRLRDEGAMLGNRLAGYLKRQPGCAGVD